QNRWMSWCWLVSNEAPAAPHGVNQLLDSRWPCYSLSPTVQPAVQSLFADTAPMKSTASKKLLSPDAPRAGTASAAKVSLRRVTSKTGMSMAVVLASAKAAAV